MPMCRFTLSMRRLAMPMCRFTLLRCRIAMPMYQFRLLMRRLAMPMCRLALLMHRLALTMLRYYAKLYLVLNVLSFSLPLIRNMQKTPKCNFQNRKSFED